MDLEAARICAAPTSPAALSIIRYSATSPSPSSTGTDFSAGGMPLVGLLLEEALFLWRHQGQRTRLKGRPLTCGSMRSLTATRYSARSALVIRASANSAFFGMRHPHAIYHVVLRVTFRHGLTACE